MADIERVITGLRYCSETPEWNCDKQCPYGENGKKEAGACWVELNRDALSLLTEIERLQPKKGKWIFTGQKNAYGGIVIQCPFCDDKYAAHNPSDEHFCRNCGAKLMD